MSRRNLKSGRRTRCALLLVALLTAALPAAPGASQPSEYDVKAAFLFNFTKFIDWPGERPGAPFGVCVLGDDPFGPDLDAALAGKRVRTRPVTVHRLRDVADATGCEILFVASSERSRLPEVMAALRERPVLTVGEWEGFVGSGGMVSFVLRDRRVRFEIDRTAADRAGLVISSKLLGLAERVVAGDDGRRGAGR